MSHLNINNRTLKTEYGPNNLAESNLSQLLNTLRLLEPTPAQMSNILKKYGIWQGSDGRYKAYDTSQPKRKLITKTRLDDLIKYFESPSASSALTLKELIDEWFLEYKALTVNQPSTLNRYKSVITRYYTGSEFEKKKIDKITALDIEKFLTQTIKEQQLTNTRYNEVKNILEQSLKYASNKKNYITENPFLKVEINKKLLSPKKNKSGSEEVFNHKEAETIRTEIKKAPFRFGDSTTALGLLLCFLTGLREGELVVLEWSDIDLTKKTISITKSEHSYNKINADGTLGAYVYEVGRTKTVNSVRTLPLNSAALDVLTEIKKSNDAKGIKSDYLFVDKGERIHTYHLREKLKKICRELDIPFRPVHKIRKTYSTLLHEAGIADDTIRALLGHSSVQTTISYYVKDTKTEQEVRDSLEKLFSGK